MPPQTGYSYFLENALKYGWAVPTGVIMLWSGAISSIPTGYVLCDGQGFAPDLRDRFIVGARQDDGQTPKTNLTGSLTQLGGSADHGHIFTADSHSHGYGDVDYFDVGSEEYCWLSDDSASYDVQGTTDEQNIFPVPYFALAYIMKT